MLMWLQYYVPGMLDLGARSLADETVIQLPTCSAAGFDDNIYPDVLHIVIKMLGKQLITISGYITVLFILFLMR